VSRVTIGNEASELDIAHRDRLEEIENNGMVVRRVRRRLSPTRWSGGPHNGGDEVLARAANLLIRKAALACRREPMTVTTWPPRVNG
jgi:hypothetical protein